MVIYCIHLNGCCLVRICLRKREGEEDVQRERKGRRRKVAKNNNIEEDIFKHWQHHHLSSISLVVFVVMT